ncbi:MAG: hypothetical protein RIR68_3166, partial [Pseudomonadota bacterium]
GKVAALRPLMSEQGYMHRRVQVEIAWFIALSDAGFAEFKPLSAKSRDYLISLVTTSGTVATRFSPEKISLGTPIR